MPRYMRAKRLASGQLAYFWELPHWAKPPAERHGRTCPLTSLALGANLAEAIERAERQNEALDEWRKGEGLPAGPMPGTVAWLFRWYREQEVFTKNSPKTRLDYTRLMDAVADLPMRVGTFGDRLAGKVTAEASEELYKRFLPRGQRQAVYMVQVCRAVWNWAARFSKATGVSHNPFQGMRKGYKVQKGNRPTSRTEYVAYCAKARELGYESMATAAMLAFELVQRVSDVFGYQDAEAKKEGRPARGLCWEDYAPGNSFNVTQAKTGKQLTIPLSEVLPNGELDQFYPELEKQLERVRPRNATGLIVVDERTGHPYSQRRVSTVHRLICDAAGLPKEMTPTGFRHGGATELGDAGNADIRPISGHTQLSTTAVYNKVNEEKARRIAAKRREHIGRISL